MDDFYGPHEMFMDQNQTETDPVMKYLSVS